MTPADKTRPAFLDQPESRRLEFKEAFPKGEQVARTVVAFANGAGGRLVFGVQNAPRRITGVADDQLFALEERVTSHIFDRCAPAIVPEIYIQAVEGLSMLVVEVFPGAQKPYYLKKAGPQKGVYVRIGSTNRNVSSETIEDLKRQRRKISFDSLALYDCPADMLNLDRFKTDYKKQTGKKLGPAQFNNMGLFYSDRDRICPTHAALLLSDSPARKRYFPYAKVECARFKGIDKRVFLDQATMDGPVYAAIEPCITFIKKNIALGATIGEIYRKDRWEYPLEAIREALVNAVIHRDYAILGSDVKVAIYDDMLEITSPGPLPDALSIEDLGSGRSEIRNRVLAPIFKDLKLIEAWGSGIRKIHDELKNYPEIKLVLQEAGQAFQVQFVKKVSIPKPELRQRRGKIGPGSQPESAPSRHQAGTKQAPSRHQVQGR